MVEVKESRYSGELPEGSARAGCQEVHGPRADGEEVPSNMELHQESH